MYHHRRFVLHKAISPQALCIGDIYCWCRGRLCWTPAPPEKHVGRRPHAARKFMGICLSLAARGRHPCRGIYILFISGMLTGALFPEFTPDDSTKSAGMSVLFDFHCSTPEDYGKALLWGFIAGFSERFATDIISRFESHATSDNKRGA